MPKQLLAGVFLIAMYCAPAVAENSALEIIPVNYRTADEILPLLAPLLEAPDRIASDGINLIVRAAPERLAQIKELVAQLDAKPHNLLITVLQDQNLSAAQLNANASVYLNVPLNSSSSASGAIQGQLNAYRDRVSSGNTQTIRTLEGQAAYIKAGHTQPVPTVTVYGGGYPVVVNSAALIEATTGFAVTPRLNGDEVVLSVSPWSERFGHNGTISTQSAMTNVRTKLGEWIEIGGVAEQSQSSGEGLLSANSGSRSNNLRILLKVDVID